MEFQHVLRELRLEKALSQHALAELVGITRATVSHLEVGRIEPNIALLKKLAETFEVSIDYLCGRTERLELTDPYVVTRYEKEDFNLLKHIAELNKNNKTLLNGFIKLMIEMQ